MEVEYAGKKLDLLPCPFCGGEPAIYSHNWVAGYHIYCTGDDCPMSPVTNARRTLAEAAADWNHRAKEGTTKGGKKPKCFYNDNGGDRCLGLAPADGDEPIERCKKCTFCESGYSAEEGTT